MDRHEAKYHAVTLVVSLIEEFIRDAQTRTQYLDKGSEKIVKEVLHIQRREMNKANQLSRKFEDFELTGYLRK